MRDQQPQVNSRSMRDQLLQASFRLMREQVVPTSTSWIIKEAQWLLKAFKSTIEAWHLISFKLMTALGDRVSSKLTTGQLHQVNFRLMIDLQLQDNSKFQQTRVHQANSRLTMQDLWDLKHSTSLTRDPSVKQIFRLACKVQYQIWKWVNDRAKYNNRKWMPTCWWCLVKRSLEDLLTSIYLNRQLFPICKIKECLYMVVTSKLWPHSWDKGRISKVLKVSLPPQQAISPRRWTLTNGPLTDLAYTTFSKSLKKWTWATQTIAMISIRMILRGSKMMKEIVMMMSTPSIKLQFAKMAMGCSRLSTNTSKCSATCQVRTTNLQTLSSISKSRFSKRTVPLPRFIKRWTHVNPRSRSGRHVNVIKRQRLRSRANSRTSWAVNFSIKSMSSFILRFKTRHPPRKGNRAYVIFAKTMRT